MGRACRDEIPVFCRELLENHYAIWETGPGSILFWEQIQIQRKVRSRRILNSHTNVQIRIDQENRTHCQVFYSLRSFGGELSGHSALSIGKQIFIPIFCRTYIPLTKNLV